ncbi:T9SS type A sorting domain-containing protein [Seonamhaeicola sp. MEBiC1930]|uniref:T9SS type A sorting domain-containing protein n=1 Tax=Seonamhaeicola sp. MEBiC01930 TaxID=2976768 RepID=UPI00324ECF79
MKTQGAIFKIVKSKTYFVIPRPQITRKSSFLFSRINAYHLILIFLTITYSLESQNQNITLDKNFDYHVNTQTLGRTPIGGDTIFINSERTFPLKFEQIEGDSLAPIVVINKGGQVKINDTISNTWGALTFENCKYIKVSGAGHPAYKYGFELAAVQCGLAFSGLSSDCEAEFIKISHDGFFGIMAKEDYGGNPPSPYPVFENLVIHDCFIEGVSEGMYLGETKSPGMEFKHVKIYNNIIRNTLRESIQIANMVEDVEIYNNTMLNAGLEEAVYHMNNLQIGTNSVVNAYNNILMDAPVWGIINMGKGDCIFTNNYIASSQGVFCDNRPLSDTLTPIEIKQNYFKSISGNQVIRNMNELNYFTAEDNKYDTDITFYLDQTGVDNDTLINNMLTTLEEIQFTDPANNDYSLVQGTAVEYLGMGAPGGPEFFEYIDPAFIPKQIIITQEMVIDSVPGGSVNSPLYLFDEQSLDIEANEHAISNSWKPDYGMNEDSYHAIIDLGDEHYISEINLHDMHDVRNFTVEYLDSTLVWNTLFVEPLDNFNVWKKHITNISTRYLRFSMYDHVFAAVNEITIHGYPLIKEAQQIVIDSTMYIDLIPGGSVYPLSYLFDEQQLDVDSNEHANSGSWKPHVNSSEGPYHALIDLGQDCHVSEINLHDMHAVYDLVVEYGDGTNWTELFIESGNSFNVWKRHSTEVITRYIRLTMPESPFAAFNEIIINGYPIMTLQGEEPEPEPEPEPTPVQIIVTSNMVTDLVTGGSVYSAQFLFDEQTLNPMNGDKALSGSWKPYYTNANAPYYVEVDLQEVYHISQIYMHDMHSVYDFNVEYDDNGVWTNLFVEPCDSFNTWKLHETDVVTQKLRLGMLDSPYAAVNEIILFGNSTASTSKQSKNNNVTNEFLSVEKSDLNSGRLQLFPNPVKETIYLKLSDGMVGTNHIQITDVFGKMVFSQDINFNETSVPIEIGLSKFTCSSGFYILSCYNDNGEHQSVKFFKD